MRALFNENLKKLRSSKKSGSGTEEIYVPTYKHFEALKFLIDQDEPRDGISSTAIVKEPNSVFKLNDNKENIGLKVSAARKSQNTRPSPGKLEELLEMAVKNLEQSSTPVSISSRLMVIESYFIKLSEEELHMKFIEILNVLS